MTNINPSAPADTTCDAFLDGRVRARQPRRGHRAGHDAILLAASVPAAAGDRVVEFGAGVGVAALALGARVQGLDLTLIEIDPGLVAFAQDNLRDNGMANSGRAVQLDVAGAAEQFAALGLAPDSVDHVMMNPPFNEAGQHQASPDAGRRRAHQADDALLPAWLHAARRLLRPGGQVTLIVRPEALGGMLAELSRGFGAVQILPVYGSPGRAAIRILARASKGARGPLALLPGIVLTDSAGQPTAENERVLRHAGSLGAMKEA